ncbi:sister chromatid cohesion protein 1 [Pleurotus ostreatus]|uniref:Sister chromatid cohesion protein 1 n=1 Tax=Pleurotus ostreatus TaxID=5322 RepID=A0A8H7DSW3_PLEOS|nr:sister chromatid cohesion protein 1 [Pleurotus ostreatus]KAF7428360.1 sister chromatid cohesion protein 1 [Pleurotus ostreatus]KAJ8696479.1 sister chromatid cohesion protein 1 [Pleurotus ostreatus]
MFYSEAILSRRGPLGKVWLAAHMERKLSKTQTLQTDIEQSVDAIMGQEIEVMALRLSGQLLLGVVRIYSRKAKYLLDDCNEALLKIKMAFRPGVADMTEDQLAVNKNAITLQAGDLDLDLMLPDINWDIDFEDRPLQNHRQHEARMADITLTAMDDFQLNAGDFDAFDLGPSDGIGSQDFGEIDLGLDWGDGTGDANGSGGQERQDSDDQMSIGVGRDAPGETESVASHLMGRNGMDLDILSNRSRSRAPSEHPFGADMNIDMDFPDFGGVDLGDLGIGFEDHHLDLGEREKTPGQTRSSRASSPLSDVPATPPPEEPVAPQPSKAKRKLKEKKQIIDSVTELQDGPGGRNGRGRAHGGLGAPIPQDVTDIVTEQHFLPRSTIVMRLLEIRDDPLAHFLPTKNTPQGTFFCAAPPGLAPELAELFMRPVNSVTSKRRAGSPDNNPSKKPRLEGEDDVERARRAGSIAPSIGMNSDILGRHSVGPDGALDFGDNNAMLDDFQMDVPEFEMGPLELPMERAKSAALSELSRLSTPAPDNTTFHDEGEETYADASCPIAVFDSQPSSQTQGKEPEVDTDTAGKGYSKNTGKALSIIRKELRPIADEGAPEKVLSFRKMSDKASRRAAASFFFELLVLSTRDCVKLSQEAPFENIEVRAKDKLWERQRHASMAPTSAAPSRLPSLAPSREPSEAPSASM